MKNPFLYIYKACGGGVAASPACWLWAVAALCLPAGVCAQSRAQVDSIVARNTSLRALRAEAEAQKLQNGAELRLPAPEVEMAYMPGSPSGVPGRTDVNVSQQLDWGVLTGRRRDWVQSRNRRAEWALRQAEQAVAGEAMEGLVNLIYYNRLCAELDSRLRQARETEELYREKFAQGGANQMELNKVKLQASVAESALRRAESGRQEAVLGLQRLNGGLPVACTDTAYAATPLPPLADLQQAAAQRNAGLASAREAVEESGRQLKLAKAMAWPALTVGFAGEYVRAENYSGLSLGFTLPLWGGARAKVRAARAEGTARRLDVADAETRLAASVQQQYASACTLRQTADRLREGLAAAGNAPLLRRALEEGGISLVDYLMEMSFYYEARTALLEAERDAQLAAVRLQALLW